jgi:hypothetical protein
MAKIETAGDRSWFSTAGGSSRVRASAIVRIEVEGRPDTPHDPVERRSSERGTHEGGDVFNVSRRGCAGRATFLRFRGDVAAARDRRAVSGEADRLFRVRERALTRQLNECPRARGQGSHVWNVRRKTGFPPLES